MDVHARSTHAAAIDVMTGELTRARFGPGVVEPVAWLRGLRGPVRGAYEAGPTGFGLHRAATAAGLDVRVVAPGKTPRGPSDRVKTDRRDAELLARLLLAGGLTEIAVPSVEIEAVRFLTRAHDATRRDLMTARHRVSKLLLLHGCVYPEKTTWTVKHRAWLARQTFDQDATAMVFGDLIAAVDGLSARKEQHARRILRVAEDERWSATIARLRAFRAIDTLSALSLHLELGGDWQRFERATQVGAWLGLTPTLNQSGESRTQGSITKTGSGLARRLLVEAAWHYVKQPAVGVALARRQHGQPDHVLAISNEAQRRLHRVAKRMKARGKHHNVITVALARELSCFLWAAATAD
jgi:transposase